MVPAAELTTLDFLQNDGQNDLSDVARSTAFASRADSGAYVSIQTLGRIRAFQASSNWGSVTVAVPMVPMATAAASVASSMPSRYDAPAEIAKRQGGQHGIARTRDIVNLPRRGGQPVISCLSGCFSRPQYLVG